MISPRAILRNHRVAPLPHFRVTRQPAMPGWWRKLDPAHTAWLVFWAPWWVGNELPPPPSPRSREAEMAEQPAGSAGAWFLDTLDDLKFRFGLAWTAALLLRGAWLGGIAGIAWLALAMLGGVTSPSVTELAALIVAGMLLGLVLRVFHRPRYASIALLLERAFDLRSRLSTAVVGLRHGEPRSGSLHALQLADAANSLDLAKSSLRPIHWVPVREVFIAFIVALTLLLLLVAQRPEGEIPPASETGVPAFVPVSERLAAVEQQAPPPDLPDPATLQEVEDLSRSSNQARQDLEAIAGALDGNQITAPAANAIASEDYPGANEHLDQASDEVSQLPQGEREALADELDEAADQVSEDNPELADASRRAADDARSGEDTGALDDLGDEIERTGESVISQQESGGELSESQADQQGDSQSGAPGGGSSAPGEQPQPGQQGAGEAQAASQGDPGSGMDASAGVDGSEGGDQTSEGGGQGSDQESSAGDQGAQGDDSQGGGESESGQSDGAAGADSGGNTRGAPNEEGDSSQGSGAGSGQTDANDPTNEGGSGGDGGDLDNEDEAPEAGQGEAGDPPPGGAEGEGEGGQTAAGGGSSIQLPGTSGERVRSGSDIGASSVGSGGGVGAASGDSTSDVSGSTGPDPNSVPEQWRTIVEDYFREGGAP